MSVRVTKSIPPIESTLTRLLLVVLSYSLVDALCGNIYLFILSFMFIV